MAENSGIAWTDHTFNPWIGCTKVSIGCDRCYAKAWDDRFNESHWGTGAPRRLTTIQNWNKVRKWNRAAEKTGVRPWVFVASLADFFDNEVPNDWRRDALGLMAECRNLNFQIVTKRIGNAEHMLPERWADEFGHCGIIATVVTQGECDRDQPKLRALKKSRGVAWTGLSIEPQLELVVPETAEGVDWIITGGESDQGDARGREYRISWAHRLIEWGEKNRVAIFVKQLGSYFARANIYKDRAGADPAEWWPESLRVRQFPRLEQREAA